MYKKTVVEKNNRVVVFEQNNMTRTVTVWNKVGCGIVHIAKGPTEYSAADGNRYYKNLIANGYKPVTQLSAVQTMHTKGEVRH